MKARPERVPASSAIWASLASRPYSARTLSKRRWKNSAESRKIESRAHQGAGGVEGLRVGDAAEAGDLGAAHPAHEAAPGGDVHRRHRQVVDVDTLLRQQVQHVLGRLEHLREPVVAERGLEGAEALAVVGVAGEVERPDDGRPLGAGRGRLDVGQRRLVGVGVGGRCRRGRGGRARGRAPGRARVRTGARAPAAASARGCASAGGRRCGRRRAAGATGRRRGGRAGR